MAATNSCPGNCDPWNWKKLQATETLSSPQPHCLLSPCLCVSTGIPRAVITSRTSWVVVIIASGMSFQTFSLFILGEQIKGPDTWIQNFRAGDGENSTFLGPTSSFFWQSIMLISVFHMLWDTQRKIRLASDHRAQMWSKRSDTNTCLLTQMCRAWEMNSLVQGDSWAFWRRSLEQHFLFPGDQLLWDLTIYFITVKDRSQYLCAFKDVSSLIRIVIFWYSGIFCS